MLTTGARQETATRRQDWLPSIIALSVIIPAVAAIVLQGRPKEVLATVFSAYGALLMAFAAAICRRKGRRFAAAASLAAGFVLAALSLTCAGLAWRR